MPAAGVWCSLLNHLKRHDLIVEGSGLDDLRPSKVSIGQVAAAVAEGGEGGRGPRGGGAGNRAEHFDSTYDLNYYRGGHALRGEGAAGPGAPEVYFDDSNPRSRRGRRAQSDVWSDTASDAGQSVSAISERSHGMFSDLLSSR